MKCKICGGNTKKPIGKALEDIKKGDWGYITLNKNGIRLFFCPSKHVTIKLTNDNL